MAEHLVSPQLPDLPVFDYIRRDEPELAAGMFEHQFAILFCFNVIQSSIVHLSPNSRQSKILARHILKKLSLIT